MRMVRRLSLVVVTVVLLASLPGAAQQPVAPPPPQIPYGTPISLEQAKKAVAAAEAEWRKNHWNMVIAVLDTGGHLVMLERMDGVQLGSIGAAEDKAYSAVMYRRPTKVFQDLVAQGGANIRLLGLRGASVLEGGIPIIVGGGAGRAVPGQAHALEGGVIIRASGPAEVSRELPDLARGIFTYYLIEGLKGADLNRDRIVTLQGTSTSSSRRERRPWSATSSTRSWRASLKGRCRW